MRRWRKISNETITEVPIREYQRNVYQYKDKLPLRVVKRGHPLFYILPPEETPGKWKQAPAKKTPKVRKEVVDQAEKEFEQMQDYDLEETIYEDD